MVERSRFQTFAARLLPGLTRWTKCVGARFGPVLERSPRSTSDPLLPWTSRGVSGGHDRPLAITLRAQMALQTVSTVPDASAGCSASCTLLVRGPCCLVTKQTTGPKEARRLVSLKKPALQRPCTFASSGQAPLPLSGVRIRKGARCDQLRGGCFTAKQNRPSHHRSTELGSEATSVT